MRISSNYHVSSGFKAKDDVEKALVFVSGGMKTIIRTVLSLQMTALLLTTALTGPAAAGTVPFSGAIEGTEDFFFQVGDPSGIDLIIHGSGGGNATHLGPFTATWDGNITFANLENPIVRTFVAANGDELYAEGPGAGTPPDADGFQFVTETMTITGGTGQFAGAGGSFDVERGVFDVAPPFIDLPTIGSFDGFIIIVPEPASMSLALLGCLLGLVARCRPKGR